jgi:hypothetical protein
MASFDEREHTMATGTLTRCIVLLAFLFSLPIAANAQVASIPQGPSTALQRAGAWEKLERHAPAMLKTLPAPRAAQATAGQALRLDFQAITAMLAAAPEEVALPTIRHSPSILTVPTPDGDWQRFAIAEAPLMEPQLAAMFPFIRSYIGQGIDHPTASIAIVMSQRGFSAQILWPSQDAARSAWYIAPVLPGDVVHYASFWRESAARLGPWSCTTPHHQHADPGNFVPEDGPMMLRIFRIAVATTGEYTAMASAPNPPNVNDAMASVVNAISIVNQVLRIDFAVQLMLVENNNLLIYTNPATDPYFGTTEQMQEQNQLNLNAVIGAGNYAIGHLLHQQVMQGASGNAGAIGVLCNDQLKGRGLTSTSDAHASLFTADVLLHEIGHQLGATHTFNGAQCDTSQYTGITAYEPGSGTTIMSYAGSCGTDNVVSPSGMNAVSLPMFNFSSITQIWNHVTSVPCVSLIATPNFPPSVLTNPGPYTVPTRTPFSLIAFGSDPNQDPLTYSWEMMDRSGWALHLGPDIGAGEPLFIVRNPMQSGERHFPALETTLGAAPLLGENWPRFTRTSQFRVVVRDNHIQGGGAAIADTTINFTPIGQGAAGGFRVLSPGGVGGAFCGGDIIPVTWAVVGTNGPPVNCDHVDIVLSLDGGYTWPYTLAGEFQNSGAALVTLPAVPTTRARIKVQAVGNIFYAINTDDFEIASGPPAIQQQPQGVSVCAPAPVELTVVAGGGMPRHFQWFRDGVPLVDGGFISGATTPTLSLAPAFWSDSGLYTCTITNGCGQVETAPVRVQLGVTFEVQPPGRSIQPCETATFAIVAHGVGTLQYQWLKDNLPIAPAPHISGINGPTLQIQGARYEDEGWYRCVVTDSCESRSSISASLSLPTPEWSLRAEAGPLQRFRFSDMAYDASRGVSVLYGGYNNTYLDDTWEWDGIEWQQRFPPQNPGRRGQHQIVYDPIHERVMLFGGWGNMPFNSEVWTYDGHTWSLLTTSPGGPPPGPGYGEATFDVARGRMVVLAEGPTPQTSRTWEFDPVAVTWSLANTGPGPYYWLNPIVYAPGLSTTVGYHVGAFDPTSTTWRWDGQQWTIALTSSFRPSTPQGAWDPVRSRVIFYGCCRGLGQPFPYSETWAYNGAAWFQVLPSFTQNNDAVRPSVMDFDTRRRAMVMAGSTYAGSFGAVPMQTWEYRYLDRIQIDRQPVDQPLTPGQTAVLRVHAAGAGTLSYQWRKGNTPLTNGVQPSGSIISGANTHTLTIENPSGADAGSYHVVVSNTCGAVVSQTVQLGSACYANCDGSTTPPVLNVDDFTCFVNQYAAAQGLPQAQQVTHYANCDGSTVAPVLNVDDFTCFINSYAQGCP